MSIEPDTKDWTWVVERACPECGFDPAGVEPERLPGLIHDNTRSWYDVLDGPGAATRPEPDVWSRLEYACHVRDVHRLFTERIGLMLAQDDPVFVAWDQDEAAVRERYAEQDPATVCVELVEAAADAAAIYARVTGEQWRRTGRRGNGFVFTIASLGAYHLHDAVHHVRDVERMPRPGSR